MKPRGRGANQKIAKFKSAYGKAVSPVLRKAGFKCRGTKGERVQNGLWQGTWLLGGKYGGSAEIVICAHPPGFPARNEFETKAPYSYTECVFKRTVRFREGRGGAQFDLGFADEAAETAAVMADAVTEDGLPYLERLDEAIPKLLAVTAERYDLDMPELHSELALCVTDSSFETATSAEVQLLLLLVRLHREAGSPAVAKLAQRGIAAFEAAEHRGVNLYVARALFERLPEGGPLHPTQDEKKAAWEAFRAVNYSRP